MPNPVILLTLLLFCSVTISKAQKAVVAIGEQHIWVGYKNKLDIALEGYTKKQILDLEVRNGRFVKEWNNYYIIANEVCTVALRIKLRNKDGTIHWSQSQYFDALEMPIPESFIEYGKSGSISVEVLKNCNQVQAGIHNHGFADGLHFEVESFDLAIMGDKKMIFEHHEGSFISRMLLNEGKPGDIIYIHNINALCKETRFMVNASPVFLRIKPIDKNKKYIISGNIRTHGTDSMFRLNSSILNNKDINISLRNKTGKWTLHPAGNDSSKILVEENFRNDTLEWAKSYGSGGELLSTDEYGPTPKHSDFYPNGKPEREYSSISEFHYQLQTYEPSPHKETWNSDTIYTEYGKAKHCLLGPWKTYYANGNIKESGSFDTTSKVISETFVDFEDIYTLTDVVTYTMYYSFKNGIWKTWNEDGSLRKTETYEMGRLKRE